MRFWRWLRDVLGDDYLDHRAVPGSGAHLEFGEVDEGRPMYVAHMQNDGFELWVGFRSKWLFWCRQQDARRLAWWVLWDVWAKGTWFGLKRRIYYVALRRIVDDARRRYYRSTEST